MRYWGRAQDAGMSGWGLALSASGPAFPVSACGLRFQGIGLQVGLSFRLLASDGEVGKGVPPHLREYQSIGSRLQAVWARRGGCGLGVGGWVFRLRVRAKW